MAEFYDWERTLSYDADVTMIVGARGIGKTFGLRKRFILDWLKDGSRFMELTRYKNELFGVTDGYFNRVEDEPEFKDLIFKTDSRYAYAAYKEDKDRNGKVAWQVIGYFGALTDAQRMKKRTYYKVRRIVLDEAIIERTDRYHKYLPNEFSTLANVVDTVSRERADTDSLRPRVYLLGNACDIKNPYMGAYHVSTQLRFGYRWYNHKTFLLHYVDPGEYEGEKLRGTVAGRMIAGTSEGSVAASNLFVTESDEFVCRKPQNARFVFGIVCNGSTFGVWADVDGGAYHVTSKCPKRSTRPIYSLTRDDYSVNYIAARRADPAMQSLIEMWYMGLVRYESVDVKQGFAEILELFGVR